MKHLYKFSLNNIEQYVLIEVETSERGKVVRASRTGEDATEMAGLSETLSKIQPLLETLNQVDGLTDNIDVMFGIKFSPDGEIIITAGQNDANFVLTIHSSPQKGEETVI